MSYELLDSVNSVSDLKKLSNDNIPKLCSEMREFLIENVEKSGGHLASNLGVVEISVAMHRIFDSPKDHIIFDVGHQAYVHKIITGRKADFINLRKSGGLSGFTVRRESEHDPFGAGHSSTSVSAALGFSEADKLCGSDAYTVCVIGDGAYTGGMVHEALNNCKSDLKLIIILNENRMSISKNKGAFASYLAKVRISKRYRKWKEDTHSVLRHIPLIGNPMSSFLSFSKRKLKGIIYKNNYFEDLGLYYIGPVDGNDYSAMENALCRAKNIGKCTVIHAYTKKGKGYKPAENSPDGFHSVVPSSCEEKTLHGVFADSLIDLASDDKDIVAITAAMGMGTGLDAFGKKYPNRYFDVGIAEEHALTFSAGLAASGLKPYCAIYSTFLQRGYDSLIHDIALQNLPVRIMIDRAGLAAADGATHHGIFDVSFLSHIPNMTVIAPVTYGSLCEAINFSKNSDTPIAIRYSNGPQIKVIKDVFYGESDYTNFGVRADYYEGDIPECVFVTYGNITAKVLEAEKMLKEEGYSVGTVLVEKLKPYSESSSKVAKLVKGAKRILFVEEGILNGGYSMITQNILLSNGLSNIKLDICAIDDNFAVPETLCDIYDYLGLSPKKLAERMKLLNETENKNEPSN